MLSYEAARAKVIEVIRARRCAPPPATETVEFASNPAQVLGRIMAENIPADRNYPPFDRATRDGFALRAADATQSGVKLRLIGESRAGVPFDGTVEPGTCVHIMTGAAMPAGADAVVMVEFARIEGDRVTLERPATPGQNFVPTGNESHAGRELLAPGLRLGYAEMAMAAQVGHDPVRVARRPHVAILSTGDEVVDVRAIPGPLEIRNGNSIALEALVRLAGGVPNSLGNAPDEICGALPPGFDKAAYATKPFHITRWLHDGDTIDLGGRTLKVLATPGHTPDAIRQALASLRIIHGGERWILVTGASVDKRAEEILSTLAPSFDTVVCTAARHKGADPAAIAAAVRKANPEAAVHVAATVADAVEVSRTLAMARNERIYVAGGLFLAVEYATIATGGFAQYLNFF